MQETSIKKCFVRLVKAGPLGVRRSKQYPVLRSLVYLIYFMHDFIISYKVSFKEAENERSDKNSGSWFESNDQFGHLLDPTTYLILLYSKLCGKFPFIIKNIFLYDLTKLLVLKSVRQRNLSKNKIKTRYISQCASYIRLIITFMFYGFFIISLRFYSFW